MRDKYFLLTVEQGKVLRARIIRFSPEGTNRAATVRAQTVQTKYESIVRLFKC